MSRAHRRLTRRPVTSQDFIFVPVHSGLHWSLVIICHPGALLPQAAAADQEVIDIAGGPASAPPQVVDPAPTAPEAQEDVKAAASSAPVDPSVMDVDAAKPGAEDAAALPAEAVVPPPAAAPVIAPFFLHLDSLSGGHSTCACLQRRGASLISDATLPSSHPQWQAAAVSCGGVGAPCAFQPGERARPLRRASPQLLQSLGRQVQAAQAAAAEQQLRLRLLPADLHRGERPALQPASSLRAFLTAHPHPRRSIS